MLNHWSTFKREAAAQWYVTLPPVVDGEVEGLMAFADALLAAGEREDVYRVRGIAGQTAFNSGAGLSYVEYLREALTRTGEMPFFSAGVGAALTERGGVQTPGKVCYYGAAGEVIEEEVGNLGLLLKSFWPGKIASCAQYMAEVPPVTVSGLTRVVPKGRYSQEPVYLTIRLDTDIWFPQVIGFLETEDDADAAGMFDNHDLAARHTPRLNRFLESVRRTTLDLGGEWEISEGVIDAYKPWVREESILLDS